MTRATAVLAVAGALVSAYLTWVHYAGIEPICSAVSNCERVQSSEYAELAGIPVAVIGVFGYVAILVSLRLRVEVTALLAYCAVGFSAYLTWAELFQIEAICQWCVVSALAAAAIAVLATVRALRVDPRADATETPAETAIVSPARGGSPSVRERNAEPDDRKGADEDQPLREHANVDAGCARRPGRT